MSSHSHPARSRTAMGTVVESSFMWVVSRRVALILMVSWQLIFVKSCHVGKPNAYIVLPGEMPPLHRLDIPANSPSVIQPLLQRRLAELPLDQFGKPVLPSDAIMLRLPDSASTAVVEEAVVQVVRDVLPSLSRPWDISKDVQVGPATCVCCRHTCKDWLGFRCGSPTLLVLQSMTNTSPTWKGLAGIPSSALKS